MAAPAAKSTTTPPASPRDAPVTEQAILSSLWRYQAIGLVAILLMFGGVGAWAGLTPISGAVIAPGSVVVEGHSKKVQHLEGGIVSQVHVRNNSLVMAGEELLRLDDTEVRGSLQIIRTQAEEMKARRARLYAERDGATELTAPAFEGTADWQRQAEAIWRGQAKLFAARKSARLDKESQQQERVSQLQKAIEGLSSQLGSKVKQMSYLKDELDGLVQLERQQLVAKPKLLVQQREFSKLEGEHGQIVADIARNNVQISETRLQIAEAKQTFISEVLTELRDVETKLFELLEREAAGAAKLGRLAVKAPIGGTVHKLNVFTVGGVVGAGETLMEIVPLQTELVVEGQLDPANIDQARPNQPVLVRFTALDHRLTPELAGRLLSISADVKQDAPQLPRYYAIRVRVDASELDKLGSSRLVPGMPAEVMLLRADRTVLNYLIRPLTDQMAHTFRER